MHPTRQLNIIKTKLSFEDVIHFMMDADKYLASNSSITDIMLEFYLKLLFVRYYTDSREFDLKTFDEKYDFVIDVAIEDYKDIINMHQWNDIKKAYWRKANKILRLQGDTIESLIFKSKEFIDVLETLVGSVSLEDLVNTMQTMNAIENSPLIAQMLESLKKSNEEANG